MITDFIKRLNRCCPYGLFILLVFLVPLTNKAQDRPNILWVVCEDISPTLSFYGDYTAKTPNLDALAAQSLVFDNAFAPVGVCAPSRSSIITGMNPTSIGTMHMRTGKDIMAWGQRQYATADELNLTDITGKPLRQYATVLPKEVKCYTEYLRAAGYFCSNNEKTDYQFAAPVTAWDQNGKNAHWRNREKDQPFFAVFNIALTHESRLWKHENLPLTVDPNKVPLPPYLPDNEATRKSLARHYSNVELMDAEVGRILDELKADGLYDNTIVFFYSDHGGPMPRQKREIYDTGLKVPFLIKDLNGTHGRTDRLISFVDLAPTMLSLAGINAPDYMEGNVFMGTFETKERSYVFGSSDRFDEFTDRIRAVRDKKYLYLRNFYPDLPKYKDIAYRKNIPMMPVFLEWEKEGKLDDTQEAWFKNKVSEELYDCSKDPYNLQNLANDDQYQSILMEMRSALINQFHHHPDLGQLPESELIDMMWPDGKQPITASVKLKEIGNTVVMSSETPGASIAYYWSDDPDLQFDLDAKWQLYSGAIPVQKGKYLYTVAQRIGYRESEQARFGM